MTTTIPNTLSQRLRERACINDTCPEWALDYFTEKDARLCDEAADAHDALVETLRMALTCQNNNCMQCKSVLRHTLSEFDAKHAQPATGGEDR